MPKQYAIAIAGVVGALGSAAIYFPQYALVFTAVATVLSGLIGQSAHNAAPPTAKP